MWKFRFSVAKCNREQVLLIDDRYPGVVGQLVEQQTGEARDWTDFVNSFLKKLKRKFDQKLFLSNFFYMLFALLLTWVFMAWVKSSPSTRLLIPGSPLSQIISTYF